MSNTTRILIVTLTYHVVSCVLLASGTEDDHARFTTWGPQSRTIRYECRLMNPTSEPATKLDVYVPLPLESPRQEIHYLHLPESRPHEVITDRHGQRLVHDTFDRLEAGVAEWSIEVPCAGSYRLLARAKSPGGSSELDVHLDGKRIGVLRMKTSENYDWIEPTPDPGKGTMQLAAGTHILKLHYPDGQTAAIQKVCLTNELGP